MAKWPLTTGYGYASPETFRIWSEGRCDSSAARYPQSEDCILNYSRPHSSDLGITADNRDQMGSRTRILAWLQNETIRLDSNFVDRILHAPGEFQNTKALVSVLHFCFLPPVTPVETVAGDGEYRQLTTAGIQVGILGDSGGTVISE